MFLVDAVKLCVVKRGVQQVDLVEKEQEGNLLASLEATSSMYASFDVTVIVAPADLRFELWFGGQKVLRESQADNSQLERRWR